MDNLNAQVVADRDFLYMFIGFFIRIEWVLYDSGDGKRKEDS